MRVHRLLEQFASRLGAHLVPQRDAHERDRARQRVAIAGVLTLLGTLHALWAEGAGLLEWTVPVLSLAYSLWSWAHLKWVLVREGAAVGRQYLFIVLDSALTVLYLAMAPEMLSPLYPVLMVQIVRCGMRYGLPTMWLAWGAGVAAAVAMMPLSGFWMQQGQLLRSFAVMMLITPVLFGPLVKRLTQAADDLREAAGADPLTGVANRRTLTERTRLAQERSARNQSLTALVLFDLDNFKKVNDTLGHTMGDRLLEQVAHGIRASCRSTDFVARVGGDEFVLLIEGLPNEAGRAKAEQIAVKIVAAIQAIAAQLVPGIPVSASAGLYCWTNADEASPMPETELIARADQAMYAAKRAGKARVVMAPA